MLYNLTLNISTIFFSLSSFRHDFCDVTITSMRFLHAGKGIWQFHFLGIFTYTFAIYTGNENVPELCVIAQWYIWADPRESM